MNGEFINQIKSLVTHLLAGFEYSRTDGYFDPMGNAGGGFFGEESSSTPVKKASKESKVQSIVPVTIKQLIEMKSELGFFYIDGKELFNIKVVGWLEVIVSKSTQITFRVNDGTGSFEFMKFIDKFGFIPPNLREYSLVRIIGNPRSNDGGNSVLVYDINLVEDWNQVTYHMLDTILVHLQHTKGPLPVIKIHILSFKIYFNQRLRLTTPMCQGICHYRSHVRRNQC